MKIEDLHFDLPNKPADEKNWDLKKWRKENPMDYLKAMSILNMTNDSMVQAETFKTIYDITRVHIPDVLHKFYSLSNDEDLNFKKFQTLEDGKIYMADIKDFNDPFDGRGFFYDPSQLAYIERLKPHGGKLIDDFNSFIRATSLTGNGVQSMPMWAHYSSNHTGFCVSYNMKENEELRGCTFPVQYTNERLDITSLIRKFAQRLCNEVDRQTAMGKKEIVVDDFSIIYMSLLLCNLKHNSWSYEREFRCTTGAIAEGMPYIQAKPMEIYIGMNCAPVYIKRLIEIANYLRVPVYIMTFDDCSPTYDLIARKM